ncbi:MAG: permease-like cell division protein FtsX, partial [Anaerotignaceae bacterium]
KEEWSAEDILEGFTGENNPLTASFEIDLDEIENQGTVLAALEKIDGIRNIRHSQAETEILIKLNNGITVVGVTVICILAVISIIIIMNTIKISVYTRRTEIGIMKFVGATDWFIRWPFIIEGVLIGVIGSALPMAISWPLYSKMVELIYTNFPVIKNIATLLDTYSIFARLSPIALVFGTVMGIVGSVTSIKKYLKV